MRFYKLKEAIKDLYAYFFGSKTFIGTAPERVTKIINVGKADIYLILRDGQNAHGILQGSLEIPLEEKLKNFDQALEFNKFVWPTVDGQLKAFATSEIKSLTLVRTDNLKEVVYEKQN